MKELQEEKLLLLCLYYCLVIAIYKGERCYFKFPGYLGSKYKNAYGFF